jgi:GTP-binding protein
VDLPGYGYAQVSQNERRAWQGLVEGYVEERRALKLVLVLVDARRELGAEEMQLLQWLEGLGVPRHLVVTKADKLGAAERGALSKRLRKHPAAAGAAVAMVSGVTGEGVDELWSRIARILTEDKDDDGP